MTTPSRSNADASGRTLGTVEILLVDDDRAWARATGRLLEAARKPYAVETAGSLQEGRRDFTSRDPDCVVCDYQLGDGTGLDLLETVRSMDPDRPFFLVTARGSESVASDAIGRGVTDYIRKDRADDAVDLLASRVENAVRSYRTERALERERRSKTALLDVLTETATDDELSREFCTQLVDEQGYGLVWIGTDGPAGPVPRAVAGEEGYLDRVLGERSDQQSDVDAPAAPLEPAHRCLRQEEPIVVAPIVPEADREVDQPWHAVAREHGFEAAVAVPVRHDGVGFGVLAVYASDAARIDAHERGVLEEYAETLGYALRTAEWKRSLLGDAPVSVEVRVGDPAAPLVALGEHLPAGSIRSDSAVERGDGTTVYVARLEDVDARTLTETVDSMAALDLLAVDDGASPLRCELATTAPTPEGRVAARGGNVERTVVEDGAATVAATVPQDEAVPEIADGLDAAFADVDVSRIWSEGTTAADRNVDAGDPLADLTDRQRDILLYAFEAGYFERPRGISATDLADRFDVARATLTQHLRSGERKVLGTVLERSDAAGARDRTG